MIKSDQIPFDVIVKLFSYDPETGYITRIAHYEAKGYIGTVLTGTTIKIYGYNVRSCRVAWALHNGCWPPEGYWVDHKDGIKGNNRITNLRLATPTQNQQNKAGYGTWPKGVTWRDRIEKPFQAKIRVNGDRIHLGSFATVDEAAQAYRDAAAKYHGEFACVD